MKSLFRRRILVTRGKSQARSFSERIESAGGVAIETPLLTFQLNDSVENQQTLTQLHDYSWIFLTSSNGVKFFFELLHKLKICVPEHLRFAIIGEKTQWMLGNYGYEADFIPSKYDAVTMGQEFFDHVTAPGNVLYIRGSRSRDALPNFFYEKQVFFQSLTVYDTLLMKEHQNTICEVIERKQIDALTFTSPSTIQAYMAVIKGNMDKGLNLPCFCIGPTTADTAIQFGFQHVLSPQQYTVDDMTEQMIQYFTDEGKR